MSNVAIKVENVSKKFTIGKVKDDTFRQSISGVLNFKKKDTNDFWALKDLNFEIQKGDVVGIIGKNGAGKSTLLKIFSKIIRPTTGRIELDGRIASLLEVGTGFHQDLTGRENIFMNGTILGMTRAEVKSKFDEIVNFSGIEQFIDTPVKKYSSGMYVRLAFSVAAHLEPEILIVDEVLAVGDSEFQAKCLGKMKEVSTNDGRTVLFVSHSIGAMKTLCNTGIFLKNGECQHIGPINDTLNRYLDSNVNLGKYVPEVIKTENEIAFKQITIENEGNYVCTEFNVDEKIIIHYKFLININSDTFCILCIIKDKFGKPIFSAESKIKNDEMYLEIQARFLTRGSYTIHTFIHMKLYQIEFVKDICGFTVVDNSSDLALLGNFDYGNVFGNYKWK